MLKISNLSYSYNKSATPVIDDINMSIEPGAIYGLLGANGAGKSTLLHLITGLLTPHQGNVLFKGLNTANRLPASLSDIFIVPEEHFFPAIYLDKWIDLNAPFYPKFNSDEMFDYLNTFRLDQDLNLGQLSMGEKKKVLIAFALACNTSLLLMDEPTNGLDIPGKSDFRRIITESKSPDRTIIISTHQVRDLDQIIESVMIMADRKIIVNNSLDAIAEKYVFEFVATPAIDAVYCHPIMGSFGIIRSRKDDEPKTVVNLELLFQCLFDNPQLTSLFQ